MLADRLFDQTAEVFPTLCSVWSVFRRVQTRWSLNSRCDCATARKSSGLPASLSQCVHVHNVLIEQV